MSSNHPKFSLLFPVLLCYGVTVYGEKPTEHENPVKSLIASLRETWQQEDRGMYPVKRFLLGWDGAERIRREYFGNDESFGKDLLDLFQNGDLTDRFDALDLISKCKLQEKSITDFLLASFSEMSLEEQCKTIHLIARPCDNAGLDFLLSLLAEEPLEASLIATIANNLVVYKEMPGVSKVVQKEIVRRIGEALIPFLTDEREYGVAMTLDMIYSHPLSRGIALALAELGYTAPELSKQLKKLFQKPQSSCRLDIAYAAYCLNPKEKWAFDFLTRTALTDQSERLRSDAVFYLGKIPQGGKRKSIPYLKAVLETEKSNSVKISALKAMTRIIENGEE